MTRAAASALCVARAALSQRGDAERLRALDQLSCLGPNGRAAALRRLTAPESREDPPWA